MKQKNTGNGTRHRLGFRLTVLAGTAVAAVGVGVAPASASTFPTRCVYPSVSYSEHGNFFNVYTERLTAEICYNGSSAWQVWSSHSFSGVPGWNDVETGRSVFYDPGAYGGALTVWANERDSFGWGPATYNQDTFLRIWFKPNGQWYSYGGH